MNKAGKMKSLVLAAILAMTGLPSFAASNIERACMRADRKAATRSLCGCVQDVADLVLSKSDQKLAASFFKTPQKAQDTRQSDSRSRERFWKRYKEFGKTAKEFCG